MPFSHPVPLFNPIFLDLPYNFVFEIIQNLGDLGHQNRYQIKAHFFLCHHTKFHKNILYISHYFRFSKIAMQKKVKNSDRFQKSCDFPVFGITRSILVQSGWKPYCFGFATLFQNLSPKFDFERPRIFQRFWSMATLKCENIFRNDICFNRYNFLTSRDINMKLLP